MTEVTQTLTLEQQATNFITYEHIHRVNELMVKLVQQLLDRSIKHDQSKLRSPEVEGFTKYTSLLNGLTFGSEEWKQSMKNMQPTLDHHYANNRHHPQHFATISDDATEKLEEEIKQIQDALGETQPKLAASIIARLETQLSCMKSPVNSMNLLDVLEMFTDWKASSERHNDGNIRQSIVFNSKRFGLNQQLINILSATIENLQ